MKAILHSTMVRVLLMLCVVTASAVYASAQTPVESSFETHLQLDLHVPDAALAPFLPAGFTMNIATQGPANAANLRVVFIDRFLIHTPDGKPAGNGGTNRLVYMVAPVKDAGGTPSQLVIGGLTEDPADVPGPFGNYLQATTHIMVRSISSGDGPTLESRDWEFVAATGERLEMHIQFERGVGNRSSVADIKFYSAKNPSFYQISRREQSLDILRNVTTNPRDRVKRFSFRAGGGSYAKLFDGTEKLLSWDDIRVSRTVLVP